MANSLESKLLADFQKAKQEQKIASANIREIIRSQVRESPTVSLENSEATAAFFDKAISAITEVFSDADDKELSEIVTVTIEEVVEELTHNKQQAINQTQKEIETLQLKLDQQSRELQAQIENLFSRIQTTDSERSSRVQEMVDTSMDAIANGQDVTIMQKQYAQLKAQLAIVKANLAGRYGERFEEIKQHLDEAKAWYDRAKTEQDVVAQQVERQRTKFDTLLGEAGISLAKRERQIKHHLQALWSALSETFPNK